MSSMSDHDNVDQSDAGPLNDNSRSNPIPPVPVPTRRGRRIAAVPYYVNNYYDPEFLPETEEDMQAPVELVDLDSVDADCDPQLLYNNNTDVAIFLQDYLQPFLCWSMVATYPVG